MIRPISRDDDAEIRLVAERMRKTLIEVLGPDVGTNMYSMDWLERRVRFHLDPSACRGEVFVAEDTEGHVVGHCIVRVETDDAGPLGLFSTTWVEPEARRGGVASALLDSGEAFLRAEGLTRFATDTSAANVALQRLFEGRGFSQTLFVPKSNMVRLEKSAACTSEQS
ncbi:MAG: GNAT family N-acetyltransferase [Myxococcales bacterium]|nr:GNAT family N-acetyltransferase [Myxococcales bacterium]MCB9581766.1 GNAT family N-acetyltransferase [Polyangiaceae bacterium]